MVGVGGWGHLPESVAKAASVGYAGLCQKTSALAADLVVAASRGHGSQKRRPAHHAPDAALPAQAAFTFALIASSASRPVSSAM